MSKAAIQLVTLAALNLKAGTQFRASLDDEAVKDYTAILKAWKEANTTEEKDGKRVPLAKVPPMEEWTKCPLPAITVFDAGEDGTINADGFHRVKGAKGAGLEEYPAEVKKGGKADAILYALGANAHHGVRLTTADKHNKLKAALKVDGLKELSNNALAIKLGLSEFFVRTNRPAGAAPKVVTTASGKKMNTEGVGKKGGNTAKKKAAAKKAGANKKGAAAPAGDAGDATGSTEGMSEEEKALAGALGGGDAGEDNGSTEGSVDTASGKKFDDETEKAVVRIVKSVADAGVACGPDLDKAIRNGTVEISTRDLRLLATSTPERIALVYPLVFGEKRMKPSAAFAFIDKIPDADTKLGHMFNLTIAKRGAVIERLEGTASDTASGFHTIIAPAKGYVLLRNHALGSLFLVPEENKEAALKALAEMA